VATKPVTAAALSLFLGLATAAFAQAPAPPNCEDTLPLSLNVGIPWVSIREFKVPGTAGDVAKQLARAKQTALAETVKKVIKDIYQTTPARENRCNDSRRLHINIALGNDYQMLDWLNRGLIDAAVVPDLALYLLGRDALPLYEIDPARITALETLMPRKAAVTQVVQRSAGQWTQPSSKPFAAEYEAFLNDVWKQAQSEDKNLCPDSEGQPYNEPPSSSFTRRALFASHLSSTGFREGFEIAARKFAALLSQEGGSAEKLHRLRSRVWQEFFRASHFAVDCDSWQSCVKQMFDNGKDTHKIADGTVLLYFQGENGAPLSDSGYREHFVITSSKAENAFEVKGPTETFRKPPPRSKWPVFLQLLVDDTPAPLQTMIAPEPTFGVRTYSFTVEEALALIRQQQRATGDKANLALVLPGGGVKAAYQTRIVDELYGEHKALQNARGVEPNALKVQTVIGTSGGALLGYFVSQLGQKQIPLYDILWGNLESSSIFGGTEMLRYASIVFSMIILCLVLSTYPSTEGKRDINLRPRLLLIWLLFLATPLVIREVNTDDFEHIPDIEGVFYMVLTIVVMGADQCVLAATGQKQQNPASGRRPAYKVLLLTGGLLLLPWVSKVVGGTNEWGFNNPATFATAFFTLVIFVMGNAIFVARRHDRLGSPIQRTIDIGSAVIIVLALCWAGFFNAARIEHIHAGIGLIVIAGFELSWVRTLQPDGPRKKRNIAIQWGITFVATFLIAALCWPDHAAKLGRLAFLSEPSTRITNGALFVSLGLILVVAGIALWIGSLPRYEIRDPQDFLSGLVIITIHALAVLLVMGGLSAVLPKHVISLELTGRFWLWTLGVSLVMAIVAVIVAVFWPNSFRGLVFLREEHPNGRMPIRRYARMALTAVVSVLWWNIVQAPALYGNRKALDYHRTVIGEFSKTRYDSVPTDQKPLAYQPTAAFVAPANLLKTDGTRYFMFLDSSDPCPTIPPKPASGAEWLVYRFDRRGGARCGDETRDTVDSKAVAEATFASGSPFPIFAAHSVPLGTKREAYVDGGYSNLTPVDAARTLQAKQVLIIQSSSPLPPTADARVPWWKRSLSTIPGKLIQNLQRLPSYLFERSQQMDRLSTVDLFCVSISPERDATDWPALFDFRTQVVHRMGCEASRDLGRRTAIVESWGQPEFRLEVDDIRTPAPVTKK
jgi:predicted acylesterase/phospholipase RssA